MKRFDLVNLEGCLMDSCKRKNFYEARVNFNQSYEGKFKIVCSNGDTKNVILK